MITKIRGVLLLLVVTGLLIAAVPAGRQAVLAADCPPLAAGVSPWSMENTPGTAGNVIAPPGTDIVDIAAGPGGDIVYAATGTNKLYKSIDMGATWLALPGIEDNANIIAVAPDNANRLAVIDIIAPRLFVSADGGASFTQVTLPSNVGKIADVDIAKVSSGTTHMICIAGSDNGTVPATFIQYFSWGSDSPRWTDATDSSFTGRVGTGAALAVKFSPNYPADSTIAVLTLDSTNSLFYELINTATKKFNADGAFGANYPVAIADSVGTASGAIALTPNFLGSDATSRVAFIGLSSSNPNTPGITRLVDYRKDVLLEQTAIKSITYNGSSLVAGEADSNNIWYTGNPLSANLSSDSAAVRSGRPGISGASFNTIVAFGGSLVYAGTSGPESAFSVSRDGGFSFNDISLIDTTIDIRDIAVSSNGSLVYLLTKDLSNSYLSVWRKAGAWERLFGISTGNDYTVRLNPDNPSSVYISERGGTPIISSFDAGNKLNARSSTISIADIAVQSDNVIYVLSPNGYVCKSEDGGFTFSSSYTWIASAATITCRGNGNLIVGGDSGEVSYSVDSGMSWTKLPVNIDDGMVQATAGGLANGDYIYAVSSVPAGKTYRWKIDPATFAWETISPPRSANFSSYGIYLTGDALYTLGFDSGTSVSAAYRSAEPQAVSVAWDSLVSDVGIKFTDTPSALVLSEDIAKLWTIDSYGANTRLYSCTIMPPSLVTLAATNINVFSATLNGQLTCPGTANSVGVQFKWGATSGNLTSETGLVSMSGAGTFSANLTGLKPNTTYYFRAEASGHGSSSGLETSFTTLAPAPPSVTASGGPVSYRAATMSGNLTCMGTAGSVNVSFWWGPQSGNLTNETPASTLFAPGPFQFTQYGLSTNTTYYFRAKAAGHGVAYSAETSFKTLEPAPPSVTTETATNITYNSAQLGGNLASLASALSVNVSFQWGKVSGVYTAETAIQTMASAGTFNAAVTGLSPSTTYYFRAKAVGDGTGFGLEKSFTTPAAPSGGGGSGGGGGGGAAPPPRTTVIVSGFTSSSFQLDASGALPDALQLKSPDGTITLDFINGTKVMDSSGNPVNTLSLVRGISPPAPSGSTIVVNCELSPGGTTFDPAGTLTIAFSAPDLPTGIKAEELVIVVWDGSVWQPLSSKVNAATGTVSAAIGHFSAFALIGKEPAPAPPPALEPARFTLSNLTVLPGTVKQGEGVTVSARVTNTGGVAGAYELKLAVNGIIKEIRQVSIGPGASLTVEFVTDGELAGTHAVELNGVAASFVVEETVPAPAGESPATSPTEPTVVAVWWILGAILLALIVGGVVYSIVRYRT